LNVEITVLVTEKLTLKKELDVLSNDHRRLKNEFKKQRVNYDLLMDEVSKTNKMNAEYRSLILENETKLAAVGSEI
jgi:cell division protein FtsL